ncbi:5170_t:CDS:2, partial [Funneliformis geosporum]
TNSLFHEVPLAPPDVIFNLTAKYKADTFAEKVNLGVGAYRDDAGKPWVLPVVKKVEQALVNDPSRDHEYLPILGLASFREASIRLILGADSPAIKENRVTAAQTISGTGANHLGALFLSRFYSKEAPVYLSNPTWANHKAIFNNAAPERSIILLHACAHNPTGVDPTQDQWKAIADVIESKKHFPFFDCAYQGFASGDLDRDAWAVRYFVERGQRAGCLTFVLKNSDAAGRVSSQLAKLQRSEISNPPAHGARIVDRVLNNPDLYGEWVENLREMSSRIKNMRDALRDCLIKSNTPGNWDHITNQIGMFSFTGLKVPQVTVLKEKFHIYLTDNGRISMAGLSTSNVKYVANSINYVVNN